MSVCLGLCAAVSIYGLCVRDSMDVGPITISRAVQWPPFELVASAGASSTYSRRIGLERPPFVVPDEKRLVGEKCHKNLRGKPTSVATISFHCCHPFWSTFCLDYWFGRFAPVLTIDIVVRLSHWSIVVSLMRNSHFHRCPLAYLCFPQCRGWWTDCDECEDSPQCVVDAHVDNDH